MRLYFLVVMVVHGLALTATHIWDYTIGTCRTT